MGRDFVISWHDDDDDFFKELFEKPETLLACFPQKFQGIK